MALNPHLQYRLQEVASRRRRLALLCRLATVWTAAAFLGLVVVGLGWAYWPVLAGVALVAGIAALVVVRKTSLPTDWRELGLLIESHFPDLEGLLLTAVQQGEQDQGGERGYLQMRLLRDTLYHAAVHDWTDAIPKSRLSTAQAAHVLSLLFLALVLVQVRGPAAPTAARLVVTDSLSVTPGDTSLEKGSSLVVLATFNGKLPPAVDLVFESAGEQRRVVLAKSLADPVFGTSIPEVKSNLVYRVEYAGKTTRNYQVTVFEHPRLERSDANLQFPEYTGLDPKLIPDTRRISAVEGSRLGLTLRFNKPVASARLVPKTKGGSTLELQPESEKPLAVVSGLLLSESHTYDLQLIDSEGRTNKAATQFVINVLKNRAPELRLTTPGGDIRPSALQEIPFEGSVWDDFGVREYGLGYAQVGAEPVYVRMGEAVPAKEKRTFQHLLRLEELAVAPDQLLCWFLWADDIGPDGQLRRNTGDLYFGEIRPFEEVYREGQGMDGQSGEGQQQGGQQGNPVSQLSDLQKKIISATWKLRSQSSSSKPGTPTERPANPTEKSRTGETSQTQSSPVAVASLAGDTGRSGPLASTWKFFAQPAPDSPARPSASPRSGRRATSSRDSSEIAGGDLSVIRQSQAQALEQAREAWSSAQDPRASALWRGVIEQMERALEKLEGGPAPSFAEALAAEQAAYQALLKLQEHEYQVRRSRRQRGQSGESREGQMQRQLDEMELTQSEDRYETKRQAQPPQTARAREESQLLNRLQELARRQQDMNERLKELQTALQEARTEQEREEVRRRLKRLQEEQQRMLEDVDEMRQRMERSENQSRMADERRQLERTREDMQRASEAAASGEASQALAAGTRAQEQLQQLRDQMRQENSSQFSEDVREMRAQARELSRQQESLMNSLQEQAATTRRSLSEASGRDQTLSGLEQQKQRLTNLVERASQVSQVAEDAEPILSRQLYDAVRKLSQTGAKDTQELQEQLLSRGLMTRSLMEQLQEQRPEAASKLLDIQSEMLRLDMLPQAQESGQRARNAIDGFRRGIEAAAQNILGDDTEALRLARDELEQLTERLQREMEAAQREATGTNVANSAAAEGRPGGMGRTNETRTAASRPAADREASGQANESAQASDREQGGRAGQNATGDQERQPGQATELAGGQPQNDGANPREGRSGGNRQRNRLQSGQPGGAPTAGGGEGGDLSGSLGRTLDWVASETARLDPGPITGDEFAPWADRIRNVEDMIEIPELRNEVAAARERTRQMRQEFKRDLKKPDWAVVRLQIINPLIEVRERVAEELARRGSREALVPVDRDPVPSRYSDLVRSYYEQLGKDR